MARPPGPRPGGGRQGRVLLPWLAWLALLPSARQEGEERVFLAAAPSACGQGAEVWDAGGWRLLDVCGATRNAHFGAYHCEAMALPALVALGASARRALVFGGPDGCVATQLLKSRDLEEVVVVSNDTGVTEAARRHMHPLAAGLSDPRATLVAEDPRAWLAGAPPGGLFDLVVVDEFGSSDLLPTEPPVGPEELARLMSPRSLLVHYGASIWQLPRARALYDRLARAFPRVSVMTTTSVEREPWHELSFVAGVGDPLGDADWEWWDKQGAHTVSFHRQLLPSLFAPAATVSRALGLQLPRSPDARAAQRRVAPAQEVPAEDLVSYTFKLPVPEDKEGKVAWTSANRSSVLLSTRSRFQHVEVLQRDGFVSLYLDGELQLTDLFGDFYHEALVHPAMAALGPRAKKVLVIGGGDGGVGGVLLKYPGVLVTQVEIDAEVIEAAKRFMPSLARSYDDPRHTLVVGDAIKWVAAQAEAGAHLGEFDLCVIDTTDEPLASLWTKEFFQTLRRLMAPHGAVVQNVGSMGDWLWLHHQEHTAAFRRTHILSSLSPDYPSPYFLSLATDELDPFAVDWDWWSGLGIETVYYHPTLHAGLFAIPRETSRFYAEGGEWRPMDAAQCAKLDAGAQRGEAGRGEEL